MFVEYQKTKQKKNTKEGLKTFEEKEDTKEKVGKEKKFSTFWKNIALI